MIDSRAVDQTANQPHHPPRCPTAALRSQYSRNSLQIYLKPRHMMISVVNTPCPDCGPARWRCGTGEGLGGWPVD